MRRVVASPSPKTAGHRYSRRGRAPATRPSRTDRALIRMSLAAPGSSGFTPLTGGLAGPLGWSETETDPTARQLLGECWWISIVEGHNGDGCNGGADSVAGVWGAGALWVNKTGAAIKTTSSKQRLVSGHGFSRAVNTVKNVRALAPRFFFGARCLAIGHFPRRFARRLHLQKVANHLVTTLGQNALRVELHALDGQRAVTQAHNHRPAAVFRGAGRDHELGR